MFKLLTIIKTLIYRYKLVKMQEKSRIMKQNLKEIRRKGIC